MLAEGGIVASPKSKNAAEDEEEENYDDDEEDEPVDVGQVDGGKAD